MPRSATVRQAAILVGGPGARPGSLAAAPLNTLMPCGDRPFLAWLLRELCRFGIEDVLLLTGHLAEAVEAALPAIRAGLPKSIAVSCVREPHRAGTGGALHNARDRLAERFLLCNGDSMLDFNLARALADAARDPAPVVGRLVLRRLENSGRHGGVDCDGDRITGFREHAEPDRPATVNAGLYLFDRRVLDAVAPTCSLKGDVLPRLAAAGALSGTVADGYFIDIGIPEDLARAQAEIPARLHRPALFLDRDGVINVDHGWVGTRDRFEFMPGALDAIGAASDAGWHVFVVTNQSGIARGHYTEADFAALSDWMLGEIRAAGGTVDDLRYCPTHPEAPLPAYRKESDFRKPGPGMILELLARWELDKARCVMIGDQPTDLEAASGAGIRAALFPGGNLARFLTPLLRDARARSPT